MQSSNDPGHGGLAVPFRAVGSTCCLGLVRFPKCSTHQHCPEDLLECRVLGPSLRESDRLPTAVSLSVHDMCPKLHGSSMPLGTPDLIISQYGEEVKSGPEVSVSSA